MTDIDTTTQDDSEVSTNEQPTTHDRPDVVICPEQCGWSGSVQVARWYNYCPICGGEL